MTTRTQRKTIVFVHPFLVKDIGRTLPAGDYEVLTDEELIEGLSFPVYRRVATMILLPLDVRRSSIEMVTVEPADLAAVHERDKAMAPAVIPATNLRAP